MVLWHYILHDFGNMGQFQAEACEQFGNHFVRPGHNAQAQFGWLRLRSGPGLEYDIHASDRGHFFDQLSRTVSKTLALHLLFIHISRVRHRASVRKQTRICASTRSVFWWNTGRKCRSLLLILRAKNRDR
jgi:hypothetical protein